MVLYNVTVSLDPNVENEWLSYMREKHIPAIMETGCFIEARLCRVHGEEEGGVTYATSYVSPSQTILDQYLSTFALALRDDFNKHWQGKFAAFRTNLSVIHEFKAP
jgi:hypothetical protein